MCQRRVTRLKLMHGYNIPYIILESGIKVAYHPPRLVCFIRLLYTCKKKKTLRLVAISYIMWLINLIGVYTVFEHGEHVDWRLHIHRLYIRTATKVPLGNQLSSKLLCVDINNSLIFMYLYIVFFFFHN